jgi:hypothetical protein
VFIAPLPSYALIKSVMVYNSVSASPELLTCCEYRMMGLLNSSFYFVQSTVVSLSKHHAMKVYRALEVILDSVLAGGEWLE